MQEEGRTVRYCIKYNTVGSNNNSGTATNETENDKPIDGF